MWNARIDDTAQQFVIEDREGNVIATRNFPAQILPNPGRSEIMGIKQNFDAWNKILNLVESANKGSR